ncbi:hypothetical protein ABMA27_017022 [Loxostege sticticalis]|uniref:DDE-1 domain-containing protein n=1 Tax=Loxostege sticticalis TaxID=481309 RepID=A0ABR3GYE7_LOXSC
MNPPPIKKRKRNVLSIDTKSQILGQHDKGTIVSSLAREHNLGEQTVRDLIKNRGKIEEFVSKSDSFTSITGRKTIKESTFQDRDDLMAKWFLQKRAGVPVLRHMCTSQAGWLNRFEHRHGIRELAIQGEKLSADTSAIAEFRVKLKGVIEEHKLLLCQIYNADETGLYWRAMPTRTPAGGNETSAPGYKKNKDRITVLCGANASKEHELKLAVGKSKNPRAFKHVDTLTLPVHYYNQSSAWMSRGIFEDWFFKHFVQEVPLLLLDNVPSDPKGSTLQSEDGNFFTMFFPPNGVIETMNRLYRKDPILNLIEKRDLLTFWKSLNIKDSIYTIARAWNGVKHENIVRAFHPDNSLSSPITVVALQEIVGLKGINESEIVSWEQCDKAELGYDVLTDEEMAREVLQKHDESSVEVIEDEDNFKFDENVVPVRPVTHTEAGEAIAILLNYFEQQAGSSSIDYLHFRKMSCDRRKQDEKPKTN